MINTHPKKPQNTDADAFDLTDAELVRHYDDFYSKHGDTAALDGFEGENGRMRDSQLATTSYATVDNAGHIVVHRPEATAGLYFPELSSDEDDDEAGGRRRWLPEWADPKYYGSQESYFECGQRLLTPTPPSTLIELCTPGIYLPPQKRKEKKKNIGTSVDRRSSYGTITPPPPQTTRGVDAEIQAGFGDVNLRVQTDVSTQTDPLIDVSTDDAVRVVDTRGPGGGPIRHTIQLQISTPYEDRPRPDSASRQRRGGHPNLDSASTHSSVGVPTPPLSPARGREDQPSPASTLVAQHEEHPATSTRITKPSVSITIGDVVVSIHSNFI
ncbi:uncharacterized protein LOC130932126 isoform X2 [Corythoichthys intestinalis]|uniref:uncharacterized protein LOC130915200 isoform X2 n=1 Tax=Corythoichthys intestinalis TaxID=161448 RepID=UPI0025A5096B|nr:uncharacterized protein LOC130915200 isoform X2 [Corythoichthys intestinalis]XP_057705295.1 uncharacterized protein LOC130923563 isoform X2 [Corythoichthys intestinalis]XP_057717527.1 uncharacterized protein LOC130932126 isoform X2 [Corythoichthys intestinalis]